MRMRRSCRRIVLFTLIFIVSTFTFFGIPLYLKSVPYVVEGHDYDLKPPVFSLSNTTNNIRSETDTTTPTQPATKAAFLGGFDITTEVSRFDSAQMKTILFMEGWFEDQWFYDHEFSVYLDALSEEKCGYSCSAVKIGEVKRATAQLLVFQPSAIKLPPPLKYSGQKWVLHSLDGLDSETVRILKRNGYDKLIDYYLIQTTAVPTPMRFLKRINDADAVNDIDADVDADSVKEFFVNKYMMETPTLSAAQVISKCQTVSSTEFEQLVSSSLPNRLHGLSADVKATHTLHCFGRQDSLVFLPNITFYVLDVKTCVNSILDQLLMILRADTSAIPVIPKLPANLTMTDIAKFVPPNSVIFSEKFSNDEKLLRYLRNVVNNQVLYMKYHEWREKYTVNSATALDPHKSGLCRLCQIAHEGDYMQYRHWESQMCFN